MLTAMHRRSNPGTRRVTLAAIVVAAAGLASCGGGPIPGPTADEPSATRLPTPGPSGGETTPTVLLAAGDIGRCDSTHDDATGALVAGLPGVVATLGDTAYEDGTAPSSTTASAGRGARSRTGSGWRIGQPRYPHRCRRAPAGVHGQRGRRDGRTWFSDTLGAWHVIVLDGNCDLFAGRCSSGSAQATWLRDDLAANSAACTIALLHQPRFTSGQHGDDGGLRPLWDALYAGGADLVLGGHDHDYERFAPQDPGGTADAARGIVEIVAGTGGAELRPFSDPRANSVARIDDVYGVLELTLLADSWSSRFLGVDGSAHDQAAGPCH